jgi:hypothetical protein
MESEQGWNVELTKQRWEKSFFIDMKTLLFQFKPTLE